MENIIEYIKFVFILYIVLTMADNLVSEEKYAVHIRFFCGTLLLICILGPVLKIFDKSIENDEFGYVYPEVDAYILAGILDVQKERNNKIIEAYYEEMTSNVDKACRTYGYEMVRHGYEINLDENDEKYGKIEFIRLDLRRMHGEDYQDLDTNDYRELSEDSCVSAVIDSVDVNLIQLKNYLANFYNINQANIYITVSSD